MITSEDTPFTCLDTHLRPLIFDDLLDQGLLNSYLHRKLCLYAELRTVDDLCQQYSCITDFSVRNKGAGKRAAQELLLFLTKLEKQDLSATRDPENNPDLPEDVVQNVWSPEVAALSFVHLHRQKALSNILFNKLVREARLQTVGDFYQTFRSIPDFKRRTPSVGNRVIQELTLLFINLSDNPAPYLDACEAAIEQEKTHFLPFVYSETDNLIMATERVIDDVKQTLKKTGNKTDRHYADILAYFYTDVPGHPRRSLEEAGILMQIHKERVRQLKNEVIQGFYQLVRESSNELLPKYFIVDSLKQQLNDLFDRLAGQFPYMATEAELGQFFANEQQHYNLTASPLLLLFDVYGISRCGKVETNFTKATFYSMDPAFDHKAFLLTANLILDVLKDEVVPIAKNDVLLLTNKRLKKHKGAHTLHVGKIPHHYIELALRQLPEIEQLTTETNTTFQVRYPYLPSNSARTERILFELGGRRFFADIMAEIQIRADQYNLTDIGDEQSIRGQILGGNGRVRSHGKLGLYEWVAPEATETIKPQSRVELVKAAIKQKGEPTALAEIEQYVNNHLTAIGVDELHNIKSTSGTISYLLNLGDLIRLQSGQYILKNWESRYVDQIPSSPLRFRKGKIRNDLIAILSQISDKTMPRRLLTRKLKEAGYSQSSITSGVMKNPMVELTRENNVTYVRLKDNHQDLLKPQQQDQILNQITNLLQTTKNHTLPMNVVVQKIQHDRALSRGQKPVVYKLITANPHLFEKGESAGNQKTVTLLAAPKASDVTFDSDQHWPDLKHKLITQLTPRLSGMLSHPIDKVLDAFFELAMLPTDEADLEALDLLPGFIWKFFSGMADDHFEHSLVREIATSMEPYLLKMLLVTLPVRYQDYQAQLNKGLSRLTMYLDRVQYGHSQRLRDAFRTAKQTRDAAAHTARSWSSAERNDRVLACITQLLYSVHCYYGPIQSKLATANVVS